jgi:ABC-type transporter Mla MlaB component
MSTHGPGAVTFAIRGPIVPADLPGLCDRVCEVLTAARGHTVYCDVAGVPADATSVDALARLQLAAGRNGCRVRLRNASRELLEVVALMGLSDVLPE